MTGHNLPADLLTDLSGYIATEMGLYFPREKWADLERGLRTAAKAFQYDEPESCARWLMSASLNQKQAEILASALTVGETYFFRDDGIFRALEETILPRLIYKRTEEKQKRLRIWSAGCATGEEPYSIAIVLLKLLPDIKSWNITVLASDINTDFLKKLSLGVYSEWSFRGVSNEVKTLYFKTLGKNKYEILPVIRDMVTPMYLNFARDVYPSLTNNTNAIDIIFCRNVLMYFSPDLAGKVIRQFNNCLMDDGCLVVGAGEMPHAQFDDFDLERINNVTIYKRKSISTPVNAAVQVRINTVDIELPRLPETPKISTPRAIEKIKQDYNALTREYANRGELKEALSWNDKAIAENKSNAELHYLRAMILLEMNNVDEAVSALNRVMFLDQDFVLAYIVMGNILQKKRKKQEASRHYKYALTLLAKKNTEDMLGDMTVGRLIDVIHSLDRVD